MRNDASGGDGIAGLVIGVSQSGSTAVTAVNRTDHSAGKGGDADSSGRANVHLTVVVPHTEGARPSVDQSAIVVTSEASSTAGLLLLIENEDGEDEDSDLAQVNISFDVGADDWTGHTSEAIERLLDPRATSSPAGLHFDLGPAAADEIVPADSQEVVFEL